MGANASRETVAGVVGTHQPLIRVQNLTKYYHGELILKDISVDIEEGDLVSIIGPSGCGKSTFMRFLVSLDKPSEGEILYKGENILKYNKKSRG